MRRSRPPRPKERKTGNHQYPRGKPPPHGRPPNASPWASETAVNPAAGTTLRRPNNGAPRSGWKKPDQNLETRRTGELPDRREEAIGDWNAAQATPCQAKPREGRGGANSRHTRRSRRMTTRSRLAKLNPCRRPRRPRTRRAVKIPGRATSMRTFKRMPGTGRRSVSSVILRRICGRATAPPPTTRRAVRRRGPSSGALKARLSVPSPDDRLRHPREREPPDAAGHQKTPGPAAGAAGKNASPSTKSGRPSSSRSGTRETPRRCCRSGHTRQDSRCSQGRGARQAHEELGKLLQKQTGERQWTPLQNRRDARRCSRPQEAERQTPPHPPGAHVWPAVQLPRPASGQEKQVIARLTASDSGERAIANDRAAPPDRHGNAHAHGGSGSGQKTATAHAKSGHGVTDIDPRIETRHDATESGSGQKTATAHSVSDHEKSVTRTMTASHAHDRLTANDKRSESDVHES